MDHWVLTCFIHASDQSRLAEASINHGMSCADMRLRRWERLRIAAGIFVAWVDARLIAVQYTIPIRLLLDEIFQKSTGG